MSGFICPHCGNEVQIFGKDGGVQIADKMSINFLGRLPLDFNTPKASDIGTPIVIKEPESEISIKMSDIADKIEKIIKKE